MGHTRRLFAKNHEHETIIAAVSIMARNENINKKKKRQIQRTSVNKLQTDN